jgi:hypothetical protein
MALDTFAKRFSVMDIGSPWRGIIPIPDGTIEAADRQTFIYLGGAVTAEGPPIVGATPKLRGFLFNVGKLMR